MEWADVLNDKRLQDLPYKIELNRFGQIVMSPATNWHGNFQVKIGHWLIMQARGGEVVTECSVMTSDNTKVADVAWMSDEFHAKYQMVTPYPVAPEILVEVVSPGNTIAEIEEKKRLYFERGAREVWTCDGYGVMSFFDSTGRLEQSKLFPLYSKTIR